MPGNESTDGFSDRFSSAGRSDVELAAIPVEGDEPLEGARRSLTERSFVSPTVGGGWSFLPWQQAWWPRWVWPLLSPRTADPTYPSPAAVDALLETSPSNHGAPGAEFDVGGLPGWWQEWEGTAPYTGEKHIIGGGRVRLAGTAVLDIAGPELTQPEVAEIVTGITFDDAGSPSYSVAPVGFELPGPRTAFPPFRSVAATEGEFLLTTLWNGEGEDVIHIQAGSAGNRLDTDAPPSPDAVLGGSTGWGFATHGLFRELILWALRTDGGQGWLTTTD